jgi:hypothetical protein
MGLPEFVIGAIVVVMIIVITAIAQPPNKWVEWFSARKKKHDHFTK